MQQAVHLERSVDDALPSRRGEDADVSPASVPISPSSRPSFAAWRVLWAVPAFVMVASRMPTPDAWAALALMTATVAVLNVDALARWRRRASARRHARADDPHVRPDGP
jgi:hypothetical protein